MDLDSYYEHVRQNGNLMTAQHARQWSDGVLRTLGTALDGRTKRALAKALPDKLAASVKGVFWLLHFRDPNLSRQEFLQQAARRSGNSGTEFAVYPTLAVFSGIRLFLANDLQRRVSESLAPEISDYWERAGSLQEAVDESH